MVRRPWFLQPCVSRSSLHLLKYTRIPRGVPTIWLTNASLGLMTVPRTHCAKIPTAATRANVFLALSAQARCVQILMNVVRTQSSADRRRCASTPSAPMCHVGLYLAPSGVCTTCPHGSSSSAPGAVSAAECTSCAPGFYGKPTIVGGCISCPRGATSPLGSLTSASCYCGFGFVQAPGSSNVSCILSFSSSLSKFVALGNPGESCNQICARTGPVQ
jgi:hypothetical protein